MSEPQEKQPNKKSSGAKKFFKVLGLFATLRFADATEYLMDGDTEN